MKTKFGLTQFFTRSPIAIANAKKAVNLFLAGLVVYVPDLAEILHRPEKRVTFYLGVSLLAVNTIGNLWGSTEPAPAPPAEQP